jgi:Flp pilus assembly protein protease CpaA
MHYSEYLILGQLAACIGFVLFRRFTLGLAAVALFVAYNLLLPSSSNIRVDLLITVPATVVVIAMMAWRFGRKQAEAGSDG